MKKKLALIGATLLGLLLLTSLGLQLFTSVFAHSRQPDLYFTGYSCPGDNHLLNGYPGANGEPLFMSARYKPSIGTIYSPWPGSQGYVTNCITKNYNDWCLTRNLATGNGQCKLRFQVKYPEFCASHNYHWGYGFLHLNDGRPNLSQSCTNVQYVCGHPSGSVTWSGLTHQWLTNWSRQEIGCEEGYLVSLAESANRGQSRWSRSYHMEFPAKWQSFFDRDFSRIGFTSHPENPRKRQPVTDKLPQIKFLGYPNDTYNVFQATNLPAVGVFQETVTTDADGIGFFTSSYNTATNPFTAFIITNYHLAYAVGVVNVDIPAGQYKCVCSPFHQYGALCQFITMNDNNSDLPVNVLRWDGTNWHRVQWNTSDRTWNSVTGFALTNEIREGEAFLIGGMDVDTTFSLMGSVNARGFTNSFAPVTVYKSMGSIFPIPDNTQFSYTNFGIVPEQGDYVQKYVPATAQWYEYRRAYGGLWDLYINGSYRFTTNNFTINRGEGVRIRKPSGSTRTTWDQEWYWWPR